MKISAINVDYREMISMLYLPQNCPTCGNSFIPTKFYQKYCSQECYPKYKKKYVPKKCLICGKEFIPKSFYQKYCSHECYKNYQKRKIFLRNYYKEDREKVVKLLGGKCVYCGCDILEALEINHKNGGGIKELKGKYNYRGKDLMLCREIISGRREIDDLELSCRVCNSVHYLEKLKKLGTHWKVSFL